MRRTCVADTEIGGKLIKKGDKVVMRYLSGNRLAELQLTIIWEEILKRFPVIQVTGEPKRVYSAFVRGYERLPVLIPERL